MEPITLSILVTGVAGVIFTTARFKPRRVHLSAHQALLRTRISNTGTREIFFDHAYVVPALDVHEIMDLSMKRVSVDLSGPTSVRCRDCLRLEIKSTMHLLIPRDRISIMLVAEQIGCENASNQAILDSLFQGKLSEALATVASGMDFDEAIFNRDQFRDKTISLLGSELCGFELQDLTIEHMAQVNLYEMDSEDVLDSEGILRITERTGNNLVQTNKVRKLLDQSEGAH